MWTGRLFWSWVLLAHDAGGVLYFLWRLMQGWCTALLPSFPSKTWEVGLTALLVSAIREPVNAQFVEYVLQVLSVYRTASHFKMQGKVCSLCYTCKISITSTSELHACFKHIKKYASYFFSRNWVDWIWHPVLKVWKQIQSKHSKVKQNSTKTLSYYGVKIPLEFY